MAADQAYDFYSPFFSAAIVTNTGARIPLWTNKTSNGTPTAAGEKFSKELSGLADGVGHNVTQGLVSFPFLESLSVELGLSFLPKMSATLTPPFEDAKLLLDSTIIEWGQSKLEAQFGYSSGTPNGISLSPVFEGLIFKPDVQMGRDVTIQLNSQGLAGYSAATQDSSFSFTSEPRWQALQTVASGNGIPKRSMQVVFTPPVDKGLAGVSAPGTGGASVRDQQDFIEFWNKPTNKTQTSVSDWSFMWSIVRECGSWMRVRGADPQNTNETQGTTYLEIFSRSAALTKGASRVLRFFNFGDKNGNGALGPVNGEFPILSVTSPTMSVYLPGSLLALSHRGVSSGTAQVIETLTTDKVSGGPRLGGGAAGAAPTANAPGFDAANVAANKAVHQDPNFPNSDANASAAFTELSNMGIKLEVQTLGIPDIVPGDVVQIRGVSKRFDWDYCVFMVRHTFDRGGFTTNLTMVSNSFPVTQNTVAAKEPIPTTVESMIADNTNKLTLEAKPLEPLPKTAFNKLFSTIDKTGYAYMRAAK